MWTKNFTKLFFYTIIVLLIVSCGKLEGEFAFKKPLDDHYRKTNRSIECSRDEELQWIFTVKDTSGFENVSVIILKKEIVWVDVLSRGDYIDEFKPNIYGSIYNLEEGDYRLLILLQDDERTILGELFFTVFEEGDYDLDL